MQTEEDIGLMQPCNVVLYETDSGATVSIVKPSVAMSMIENSTLAQLAQEVEGKLKQVFDSIS